MLNSGTICMRCVLLGVGGLLCMLLGVDGQGQSLHSWPRYNIKRGQVPSDSGLEALWKGLHAEL